MGWVSTAKAPWAGPIADVTWSWRAITEAGESCNSRRPQRGRRNGGWRQAQEKAHSSGRARQIAASSAWPKSPAFSRSCRNVPRPGFGWRTGCSRIITHQGASQPQPAAYALPPYKPSPAFSAPSLLYSTPTLPTRSPKAKHTSNTATSPPQPCRSSSRPVSIRCCHLPPRRTRR